MQNLSGLIVRLVWHPLQYVLLCPGMSTACCPSVSEKGSMHTTKPQTPGSYTRSHARPGKNTTNQNLLWQNFIAYIFRSRSANPKPQKRKPPSYIFRSQSSGAPKRRARSIVYIFRSQKPARASAPERRAQVRERMAETPSPLRRSYPSLRTHHSLIGCSP